MTEKELTEKKIKEIRKALNTVDNQISKLKNTLFYDKYSDNIQTIQTDVKYNIKLMEELNKYIDPFYIRVEEINSKLI